jgi:hypothetical protein
LKEASRERPQWMRSTESADGARDWNRRGQTGRAAGKTIGAGTALVAAGGAMLESQAPYRDEMAGADRNSGNAIERQGVGPVPTPTLPPGAGALQSADRGEYRAPTTGEAIKERDLLTPRFVAERAASLMAACTDRSLS